MRIMIFSNLFPPDFIGGYELLASEVAQGFAANGHEVLVVTSPLMSTLSAERNWRFTVTRPVRNAYLSVDPTNGAEATNYEIGVDIQNLHAINDLLIDFRPDCVYCLNLAGLGSLGIVWFLIVSGYQPVVHLGDNIFSYPPEYRDQFVRFSSYFGLERMVDRVTWVAVSDTIVRETSMSLMSEIHDVTLIPAWTYYRHYRPGALRPIDYADGRTKFVFASRKSRRIKASTLSWMQPTNC